MAIGLAVTLAAAAEEVGLLADAEARIAQHRQTSASIGISDADGRPLAGAEVQIEQTSHAFLFGCNVFLWGRVGSEADEALYRQRFADLFNYATLPFYWPSYEPRRDQPQHDRTEQIARWCREHQIVTKGHPLAWNFADPAWLPDDPEEIRRLQLARIGDCVGRFRGLIDRWDVVNEATHFERDEFLKRAPKLTKMWEKTGRVEFVHACFAEARRAGPEATLLINDYRTDPAYEQLLQQLVDSQGRRLYDVIGIQSHMHGGTWDDRKVWEVCERFARFGVPLHFTETTILSGDPGRRGNRRRGLAFDGGEGVVAGGRGGAVLHPAVLASRRGGHHLVGLCRSQRLAGMPAGFLRADLSAKPAYERLLGLVKGRWWTRVSGRTDEKGQFAFRGFLGRYRVTVTSPGGQQVTRDMTLQKGTGNQLEIRWQNSGS